MKPIKRNDFVRVTFLDHTSGHEPYAFVVCGRLLSQDRTSISVGVWVYASKRESDCTNVHQYTIVRSAITKIERLIAEV